MRTEQPCAQYVDAFSIRSVARPSARSSVGRRRYRNLPIGRRQAKYVQRKHRTGAKWGFRRNQISIASRNHRGSTSTCSDVNSEESEECYSESGSKMSTETESTQRSVTHYDNSGQENPTCSRASGRNGRKRTRPVQDDFDESAQPKRYNTGRPNDGSDQSYNSNSGDDSRFSQDCQLAGVHRFPGGPGPGVSIGTGIYDGQRENNLLEEHFSYLAGECQQNEGRPKLPAFSEITKIDCVRHLANVCRTGTLVSDILYPRSGPEGYAKIIHSFRIAHSTASRFCRTDRDTPDALWALHCKPGFQHIHIVHGCSAGTRGCRDWISKTIRECKSQELVYGHFRRYYGSSAEKDFMAFSQYVCEGAGRGGCVLYTRRGQFCLYDRPQDLFDVSNSGLGAPEHVEERGFQIEDFLQQGIGAPSSSRKSKNGDRKIIKGEARRSQYSIIKEIEEKLLNIGAVPIDSALHSKYWLTDELFGGMDINSIQVKNAIRLIHSKFMDMTGLDYLRHYNSENINPVFSASSRDTYDKKYYPWITSAKIILSTLLFQFNNNKAELWDFLSFFVRWFNRETNKVNTLIIVGEPSAGKNYIFDSFKSWVISYGTITELSRGNRFGLQDCVQKRVIIWNEFMLDPAFEEQLLDIMGGTDTKVPIKHHPSALITHTPVLLMGNFDSIPSEQRFNLRCRRFRRWRKYDYLDSLTKKPDPLAWSLIFNRVLGRPLNYDDACLDEYFL